MSFFFPTRVWGALLASLIVGSHWVLASFGETGLYWETRTTQEQAGRAGEPGAVTKHFFVPKKIRIERQGSIIILRGDRRTLYELHPSEKTYTELSFAQMDAMAGNTRLSFERLRAKMKKELERLPESSRKVVQERWERYEALAGEGGQLSVSSLGEPRQIAGYPCQGYVVRKGTVELVSVYATKDVEPWKKLKGDFFEFQNVLRAWHPGGSRGGLSEALAQIDGFPMETSVAGVFTAQVVRLETQEMGSELFEVPTDYKLSKEGSGSPVPGGPRG
ncbi:DUF4412 domain-containing protein [Candidatus Methylacidithermus pantelleriae]|uniref:DUF4412 domain-containing protein n=1 Tax=Candidatus Methylacidithermus pantelleriae TaxID=2744239 RepID=UPI00157D73EE|nr:DUF4412 domain-containing protein [Candidatus Methylacidithermus pantelleriae]